MDWIINISLCLNASKIIAVIVVKIRPLARLGYYDYTSVTDVFEMRIPGASSKASDGLEGKSS